MKFDFRTILNFDFFLLCVSKVKAYQKSKKKKKFCMEMRNVWEHFVRQKPLKYKIVSLSSSSQFSILIPQILQPIRSLLIVFHCYIAFVVLQNQLLCSPRVSFLVNDLLWNTGTLGNLNLWLILPVTGLKISITMNKFTHVSKVCIILSPKDNFFG